MPATGIRSYSFHNFSSTNSSSCSASVAEPPADQREEWTPALQPSRESNFLISGWHFLPFGLWVLPTFPCVLSHFSPVRLFATPWMVALQPPLSMGFSHARILEWAAISFSRGSFPPRDVTCLPYVSCIGGGFFTTSSTWETPFQYITF